MRTHRYNVDLDERVTERRGPLRALLGPARYPKRTSRGRRDEEPEAGEPAPPADE